jgi:tetratricopeptide (TPR) repeat protein
LNFIVSHAPEDVVCEKTRFVAKWGSDISVTKKAERAVKQDRYGNETDVKALANNYWVRFEYSKARKLFQQALEINPDDTESLEALALTDIETEKSIHTVIARYEHLLTLVPNSERYLRMLALLLLESDNERGEEYARRLFNMRPNDVMTRNALSGYYLRKGAFSEAKAVVEHLKDATDNAKVREFAEEGLDYIDRYETDGRFRKKEKARRSLRKLWWFIGAFVVPLLGLLYLIYGIVQGILEERGAP